MFSLFKKSPLPKLQKQYSETLANAMQAQRKGDIRLYSELSDKAQAILDEITTLESQTKTD